MSDGTSISFLPSDRALMVVSDITVRGATRIQKYGFLLAKQYKKETANISKTEPSLVFYNDWEPLWFGPFSKSLAKDIDDCVERGLIHKEPVSTSPDSYRFSLTIKGRKRWRDMLSMFTSDMTAIYEKVAHLQKVGLGNLLEGIYSSYPDYTVRSVIRDRVQGD